MAKIAKIKWNNINGGTDRTDIYPITSDRAVYNADNKTLRQVIRERGVVNISTYFTYDGTPEKLTLETALKKITEENRCPGFLATILTTEDEWWTFRYNAYTVDDDSWNNTDNWSPFHAGWLKTDTTSEDPETPLHLEWIVKNYIYTLKGWIDAVSTERNGYFTAEDYKKFLQALEDIKNLQERMAAAEATLKDHEDRLTSAEKTIEDHESRLVSAEGRITSVEGRMSSAEGRLDSAENNINSINNSIASINSSITSINSSISSLQNSIASINSSISNINAEIENLKDYLANLKIATVVQELPTSNISTNTIYLVPAASQENLNKYAEYVYADGEWEKLGEVQLETDLTGYVKEEDLDGLVSKLGYIKAVDIPDSPVTSVQVSHTDDDSTDILDISPTTAQEGKVSVKIGVNRDNLKNFLDDEGYGSGDVISGEVLSSWTYNVPVSARLITGVITTSSVNIRRVSSESVSTWKGHEALLILKAEVDTVVTYASNFTVTDGVDEISLSEGEYVEISIIGDGSDLYVRSSSRGS